MRSILILTAGFGEGHNTAARGIRDGLERTDPFARVEVLDLFDTSYGRLNTLAKSSYLGVVEHLPCVWGGIYQVLDQSDWVSRRLGTFGRLGRALAGAIDELQPDVVVSTFPVYAHVVQELFKDHAERPFRLITVVTDSITVNSAWYRAWSDLYCVPNPDTARVLVEAGVPEGRIRSTGFPVSPRFAELAACEPPDLGSSVERKVLVVVKTGTRKLGKVLSGLLAIDDVRLTVTVGRDAGMKAKVQAKTRGYEHRVAVLGWTQQMPELMARHHLIVTKAGGATVQEAIAARCPMIINHVIPGQEVGNAMLVADRRLGAIAARPKDVVRLVEEAFLDGGRGWREWRGNVAELSRPRAALEIAELILKAGEEPPIELFSTPGASPPSVKARGAGVEAGPVEGAKHPSMLLCDFHVHSSYSDGVLTVEELVDFYGKRRFDCLCITDHLADPRRLIGKLSRLSRLTLNPNQIEEYFEVIEEQRERAWRKYGLLLMTGIEFNKDGYTRKTSAHLLALDLKAPVPSDMDLPETIEAIHAQGGLAVASHPHLMKSEWGKNTLYLWENQDVFAPLIDAWEIANRNNIFTPVSLKRLPMIANSDFHKPKHILSWKTLLWCEKSPEAIKRCVRENRHVSIMLYREGLAREHAGIPGGSRELSTPELLRLEPVPSFAGRSLG